MSYENTLIREATGDDAPNHDDACPVCDKIEIECECPTGEKQDHPVKSDSKPKDWYREQCSECGGRMLSVYHRRGSLLPICALCADKYSWPIL